MDNSSGIGMRVGYLGKLGDTLSVGASYSPKVGMSRFKRYQGLFAENGDFDIPAGWTVGAAWQATPSLQLALDYQKILYSGVRSIANASASQDPLGSAGGPGFGWKDIGVVKLGVQWQASPTLTVRAGYNQGQNPVPGNDVTFNIVAPGVVTDHMSLGVTLALDKESDISLAYTSVKNRSVTGPSMFNGMMPPGTPFISETIRMKQQSIGVQYSRRF
jgi:long-chain fatty acid transport protein